MPIQPSRSRIRFAVFLFFLFILLHQTDKLLIGPLTPDILETFNITYTQMGAVTTGALLVGAVFLPLWGYLYDRYARNKLLALASALWGATTWLNGIAPSYPFFLVTRASTGIDDSSYPGVYSLVSDYFKPHARGKIYGLLQLAQPIGYLLGLIMALLLTGIIGWRSIFFITGSLGLVVAIGIYFGVPNVPRGGAEPELAGLIDETGQFRFNRREALNLLKKPSLVLLFVQGFFGVFPWNVITYWFFTYLERERFYASDSILTTMLPTILILAAGYPLGGALGDFLFKRTPRGRLIVAVTGTFLGAVLLFFALNVPLEQPTLFTVMMMLTALVMPWPAANVLSTVSDVTLPEVRSTGVALLNFLESGGSALAPLIAGIIADQTSLGFAILSISTVTWGLCVLFFLFTILILPKDILALRRQMQERAVILRAAE
jgi:MFS transporter, Spinster family, sphingosine-1-phosphate transporter